MILRDATAADAGALESFDLGEQPSVWLESVLAEMQRDGVLTASWLVHPANLASAAFSRTGFPDADETYPPEDRPYARFILRL